MDDYLYNAMQHSRSLEDDSSSAGVWNSLDFETQYSNDLVN